MAIYSKNTWTDRNVSKPNAFTKSLETSTTVTLIPDAGVIIAAGTAISGARMNNIEAGIDYAVKASRLFKYRNIAGSI